MFVTSAGVTVVDAKNPGWGQPIIDKVKELTPKPITMLINTHTHGDHVSGNVEFPATVDVVVQENTKTNMEKMDLLKQNDNRGMAKRTFKDTMTIGKGADEIDLYYFGPGHTNGDAWVVFPRCARRISGTCSRARGCRSSTARTAAPSCTTRRPSPRATTRSRTSTRSSTATAIRRPLGRT